VVQHEIIGDDMQAVILSLAAGDVVRAEAGAMMFMTGAIEMDGVRLRASAGFKIRLRPAAGVGSRKPEAGSRKSEAGSLSLIRWSFAEPAGGHGGTAALRQQWTHDGLGAGRR
jgi:hypothetical protein